MSLPSAVTHQDKLLTIDTNVSKFLEGLLAPGVKAHPLFIDPYNGVYAVRVKWAPGVTLPLHFHSGSVHAYTMSGCWYYNEYPDQKQTAGCYLYEPAGSMHSFTTPSDNTEDTDTFMMVTGANINFDADGAFLGIMDSGLIKGWVDQGVKDQGLSKMNYIIAGMPGYAR